MTITSGLRFLYIFLRCGLLCGDPTAQRHLNSLTLSVEANNTFINPGMDSLTSRAHYALAQLLYPTS
jgi:hypothetical protein